MSFPKFNSEYAIQAALFLLNKAEGKAMDCVKLMKLLYFADREYLVRNSRFITTDSYVKMENGPVPINLYNTFKDNNEYVEIEGKNYKAIADVNLKKLALAEIECLDSTFEKYFPIETSILSELSHNLAWNNAKEKELLKIEDIVNEVGIDKTSEILEYYFENLENERLFA